MSTKHLTLLIYRFSVLVLSVHIEYTYHGFQFLNDVNEDVIKKLRIENSILVSNNNVLEKEKYI